MIVAQWQSKLTEPQLYPSQPGLQTIYHQPALTTVQLIARTPSLVSSQSHNLGLSCRLTIFSLLTISDYLVDSQLTILTILTISDYLVECRLTTPGH